MKQILIILGLFASITTFAQSPRIKLNQITKDTVKGSVLISSPSDSGMVYSRDFYIAYGADTVLILYGDTLAATSGIISSVLSDGVTIIGDGTTGSELTVDTNTVIATKQDLDLYYLDSNPDGYTSNTGTVTSVGGTGTVNGISLSGTVTSSGDLTLGGTLSGVDLASQVTGTLPVANGGTGSDTTNFVDLTNAQTVGGPKTFTSTVTGTRFDPTSSSATGNGLYLSNANEVAISTNSTNRVTFTSNGRYIFTGGNNSGPIIDINATANNTIGDNALQMRLGSNCNNRSSYLFVGETGNVNKVLMFGNGDISTTGDIDLNDLIVRNLPNVVDLRTDRDGKLFNGGSDERLKNSINDINFGLQEVMLLKPKEFWRNEQKQNFDLKEIGFIAQDVRSVIPNAVVNSKNGYYQLRTDAILATSIKAIQEQQAIIESQATEIEQLKSQIQLILSEIEQIKNN